MFDNCKGDKSLFEGNSFEKSKLCPAGDDTKDCSSNGKCDIKKGCVCNKNFGGDKCEIPIKAACDGVKDFCKNSGTCDPVKGCVCSKTWGGKDCSKQISPCLNDANYCGKNGKCQKYGGCSCKVGFSGDKCQN